MAQVPLAGVTAGLLPPPPTRLRLCTPGVIGGHVCVVVGGGGPCAGGRVCVSRDRVCVSRDSVCESP